MNKEDIYKKVAYELELFHIKAQEFKDEKLSGAELKPFGAKFGFYEQKDGRFMVRVRIPGGEITTKDFSIIASNSESHGAAFLHFTTRQDIQIHGLDVTRVYPLVESLFKNGIVFRGGGGDTFRNITSCPHSGCLEKTVFDVLPFVKALNSFMLDYDKAFKLPRKLKISFSCCREDSDMASFTDLGFIAVNKDGKAGFEVWLAGGLGRESMKGIRITEFTEAKNIFRYAAAITELFHDHGDRKNRASARLRFVLKRLGEEEFRKLFAEYYSKKEVMDVAAPAAANAPVPEKSVIRHYHVVHVPGGNLKSFEADRLVELFKTAGIEKFRITRRQNILIPAQGEDDAKLLEQILSINPLLAEIPDESMPVACIGAKVCKIGIADSQTASLDIFNAASSVAGTDFELKAFLFKEICSKIRVSGCHNSCAFHHCSGLGFQGFVKRDGEKSAVFFKIFVGGSNEKLGHSDEKYFIKASETGVFMTEFFKARLLEKNSSFEDFTEKFLASHFA